MPPDGELLDALLGELLAAVALDAGPVLTVPLPTGLSAGALAGLVDGLAARAGPGVPRVALIGDDLAFVGAGEAITLRDPDGIAATVAAARGRRLVVALPFSPVAPASSAWTRHRARVALAPRVWLHHRQGEGALGVDLGVDDHRARREARALLERWRQPETPGVAAPSLTVQASTLSPDAAGHHRAVDAALDSFAAGRLQKVVLARRHRHRLRGVSGDLPLALFRAARPSSPSELRYLIDTSGDALVGVSPERLCRRRGRRVEVDVLAGTSSPGDDTLLIDDKERREHEAVRRFVVAALAPVSAHLEAPTSPALRRLRQVQHLHTPVSAELREEASVFLRLHPTPAVAGSPREGAVAVIAALEGFDRGLYAGAVGVVDADGEDLQVALRCAHVIVDDEGADVDLYAGSGLVPGSEAGREWQELDRKEATMGAALAAVLAGGGQGGAHGPA